ncbi:aminopeptidase N-like [Penaeus vannamei]|uniref:aminopeptidase N-like n=1 Tax=Penaeus vannamei TaxID=6689 RepID=UPI00387F64B4
MNTVQSLLCLSLHLLLKVLHSGGVEQRQVGIKRHHYDPVRQFYVAHMDEELIKGERYTLQMEFLGYLNDQLRGFYRSTYRDDDGTTKYLAVTHFQPTHARRAFPCFDEPALKATFEVHLARETWMTSLSNMPLAETRPVEGQEGWVWDRFERSVPMSTYLVAFVVSDFSYIPSTSGKDTLFRMWVQPSAILHAEYVSEVGSKILAFYESYFNVSYPLPKMDMVAVPDIAVRGMENWGLITMIDRSILYDPDVDSANHKDTLLEVVAHELAHQWFGNLVTPRWWDDLWLNEGFATFVAYIGSTYYLLPGASIVRMMTYFLGESTFRRGLNSYLNTFAYTNAEQDDLWEHLTAAAHRDRKLPESLTMKTIMDTWTLQKGFPVIKVARSPDGTSAQVSQEHFMLMKERNPSRTKALRWWVPLSFTSQREANFNQTEARGWMKDSEERITLTSLPPKDQWVIFNLQQTGYYRVNYDDHNWGLLIQQLRDDHKVIHVVNRAQIIDDAMNLARTGQLSYTTALDVYGYLKKERDLLPWTSGISNVGYVMLMLGQTPALPALRRYILDLLAPAPESHWSCDMASQDSMAELTLFACRLGRHESLRLFRRWMRHPENRTSLSPNHWSEVLCTGVSAGGEKEWELVWNEYLNSNTTQERTSFLTALACSENATILSRYLEMSFNPDMGFRKDNFKIIFSAVANNIVGRQIAWTFLKKHWNDILTFKKQHRGYLLNQITHFLNTNRDLADLQAFLQDRNTDLTEVARTAEQVLERTKNNVMWMEANVPEIVKFLEDHGYASPEAL